MAEGDMFYDGVATDKVSMLLKEALIKLMGRGTYMKLKGSLLRKKETRMCGGQESHQIHCKHV